MKINIIFLALGLIIGGIASYSYYSNREFRNPEEIADYLEEMVFNGSHYRDLQHYQLEAFLKIDTTTLGQVKNSYMIYTMQARHILGGQIGAICYKKEWK